MSHLLVLILKSHLKKLKMKFKKDLIEKLRKGEIALSNVGSACNPELIKSILYEALGHETFTTGKGEFYFITPKSVLNPTQKTPQIHTYSASEFIESEFFEFSNDEITWVKGKEISSAAHRGELLHMVELKSGGLFVYKHKREIQPKLIERWVNITPIGGISVEHYLTEEYAKRNAGKGDIQVKLTGEY